MENMSYDRKGDTTRVWQADRYLGRIVRQDGSDSSPRGRAYRTFHYPVTPLGDRLSRCYTRKEAVEALLYRAAN